MTETQDTRLSLLNAILTTPHGELHSLRPIHETGMNDNPRFYMHLGAWYNDLGKVRDHQLLLASTLALSTIDMDVVSPMHRRIGNALLSKFNPRLLAKSLAYMSEVKSGRTHKRFYHALPRRTRNMLNDYLDNRESDVNKFDRVVASHRNAMRELYQGLHRIPGGDKKSIFNQILFVGNPPEGTVTWAIKNAKKFETDADFAVAIVENNIPFPVAVSARGISPTIMLALANAATPMQIVHNRGFFKKNGAFENRAIATILNEKLQNADQDKRFVASRVKTAVDATGGPDDESAVIFKNAADKALKSSGTTIKLNWAGFLDRSTSMDHAFELARDLFATAGAATDPTFNVHLCTFNSFAEEISVREPSLNEIDEALRWIRASGMTSFGAPIEWLISKNIVVDKFIYVSDCDETTGPRFAQSYNKYVAEFNVRPHIIIVRTPDKWGRFYDNDIAAQCQRFNIDFTSFDVSGDSYSHDDVILAISKGSMLDLVNEIMDYPLPV